MRPLQGEKKQYGQHILIRACVHKSSYLSVLGSQNLKAPWFCYVRHICRCKKWGSALDLQIDV